MSEQPIKETYYYDNNEKVECEIYHLNYKRHREDGPAFISYYKSGEVKREQYYLNGKPHNSNGPAAI